MIPMFPHLADGPVWSDEQIAIHAKAKADRVTPAGNLRLKSRMKPWQREAINYSFDVTGCVARPRSDSVRLAIAERRYPEGAAMLAKSMEDA